MKSSSSSSLPPIKKVLEQRRDLRNLQTVVSFLVALSVSSAGVVVEGFSWSSSKRRSSIHTTTTRTTTTSCLYESIVNGNNGPWELEAAIGGVVNEDDFIQDDTSRQEEDDTRKELLKRDILQWGASYDRGFGATNRARIEVDRIISKLEALNPEDNASFGIDGSDNNIQNNNNEKAPPLVGNWRMIWTTASDVLILGTNPFITVGAIYQLFTPPTVTNVIDLLPRFQPIWMIPSFSSLLRINVQTKASSRTGRRRPMQVGLVFERVKVEPIELLGNPIMDIVPPLAFDLPKLPSSLLEDGGYFDVTYLDSDLLIIRQSAISGGGLFVLTRVDNSDP